MGNKKEPVQEKIEELVSRIVERFRPEKIILFGSHARGTAGQDSDADILVVMPVKGSKRKKATEIDVALVGLDLPVDVIVVTPEELERNKNQIGTIIYPALKEGKVLYEKVGEKLWCQVYTIDRAFCLLWFLSFVWFVWFPGKMSMNGNV